MYIYITFFKLLFGYLPVNFEPLPSLHSARWCHNKNIL